MGNIIVEIPASVSGGGGGDITVYETLAALRLATGTDNNLVYCRELESWFRYEATGSSYGSDNGDTVIATGHGGDTRWIAAENRYAPEAHADSHLVEGSDAISTLPTSDQKDALQGTDGTPSDVNRYVTDTDARLTDSHTPTAHASSHLSGGSDSIQLASSIQEGLMSDAYASKVDGIEAGADVTDAANVQSAGAVMDGDFSSNGFLYRVGAGSYGVKTYGSASDTVCEGDDSRLSDARTPTAHASTHDEGGSDELTELPAKIPLKNALTLPHIGGAGAAPADSLYFFGISNGGGWSNGSSTERLRIANNAGVVADILCAWDFGTGNNDVCEGNDPRLSDARTPTAHASTHGATGSDKITSIDQGLHIWGYYDVTVEALAPSAPSTSRQRIYFLSDALYYKNSSGGVYRVVTSNMPGYVYGHKLKGVDGRIVRTSSSVLTYDGKYVVLWDGSDWVWKYNNFGVTFDVTSDTDMDSNSISDNSMYDVFAFDSAGALGLALKKWTSAGAGSSSRGYTLYDYTGVLVYANTTSGKKYRYLGTIYTTSPSAALHDDDHVRYVWNYYNRLPKSLHFYNLDSGSYTYNTATWREAGGLNVRRAHFVIGVVDNDIIVHGIGCGLGSGGGNPVQKFALNGSRFYEQSGIKNNGYGWFPMLGHCTPAAGLNYLTIHEYCSNGGTCTFESYSGAHNHGRSMIWG